MIKWFKNRKRVIYDRNHKKEYLIRYYLFLRNRKNFPFNITLHKILKSDVDDLHDHPWSYATLILKGGYYEWLPVKSREGNVVGSRRVWRGPGHFRKSKANDLHRLELQQGKDGNEIPCWSLFIMGKQRQNWGFVKPIQGTYTWIHNDKYLKEKYDS